MNRQQVTSILLCALLTTSFAHDLLRAKHLALSSRSQLHHQDRASGGSQDQCSWICKSSNDNKNSTSLQLFFNATIELIGIVNVEAKSALVIDIKAGLAAVLNGTSGSAIIVNVLDGTGLYIEGGKFNKTWLAAKISFEAYFKQLESLEVFIKLNIGEKFTLKQITDHILQELGEILKHLSVEIAQNLHGDLKVIVGLLEGVLSNVFKLLRGPLKGLLQLVGSGVTHLAGDIHFFIGVLEGLATFVGHIAGGIGELIKLKIELDLGLIFGAVNGVQALVNLLLALVSKGAIHLVAGLLNNAEALIEVIAKLGGGILHGVTGVFKLLGSILSLLNGNIKIDAFISFLIDFAISNKDGGSIDLNVHLEGFLKVIELSGASNDSKGLIEFVHNLQQGTLNFNGVDLSAVLKGLLGGVGNLLEFVVGILLKLEEHAVKIGTAIPALLLHLFQSVSPAGLQILAKLGINIDVDANGHLDIVKAFKGIIFKIPKILLALKEGDISKVLEDLPIFGTIYNAVAKAVKKASNGTVDLKKLLSRDGDKNVIEQIKNLIEGILKSVVSGSGSAGGSSSGGGSFEASGSNGGSGASGGWSFGNKFTIGV
ncbi:unnamed protein product [Acanthoscelides obtectus]|uniref:Uncharacterized protein n=1 Tax=Acanthoscelides obtectus TaxID=200917 RepID=A0A9P0NTQ3_ACAOB|nr:unnamed protein product [Acanthoscelides obtectus]CAK1634653.1 hypothetical protein AOBTE_LOCUS8850 [Acanthoscelides obtectus]